MPKYYVYSSDTKINMLGQQIEEPGWKKLLSKVKPEIGFEKFGFKAKVSMDGVATEPKKGNFSQISPIVDALRLTNLVGTVIEPKEWFEGSLNMK